MTVLPRYLSSPDDYHPRVFIIPRWLSSPGIYHPQMSIIPRYLSSPDVYHPQVSIVPRCLSSPGIYRPQMTIIPRYHTLSLHKHTVTLTAVPTSHPQLRSPALKINNSKPFSLNETFAKGTAFPVVFLTTVPLKIRSCPCSVTIQGSITHCGGGMGSHFSTRKTTVTENTMRVLHTKLLKTCLKNLEI